MLQAERSGGSSPYEVIEFFSIYLILPVAQCPGVYSTSDRIEYQKQKKVSEAKRRPVCKADNLAAICEQIVYKIWAPQYLTTLYASTAYYGDSFTFFFFNGFVQI
jgi:hypothetical protein